MNATGLPLVSRPTFAGVSCLADVPPDVIRQLDASAALLSLRKGDMLFRRGDPAHGVYVVIDGLLRLSLPPPGECRDRIGERAIEMFAAGALFGEDCLFDDSPQLAECQAQARSVLLHVGRPVMRTLLAREPGLASRLMANLAARMRALMRDVEATSLKNAPQRTAGFLLEQGRAAQVTWLAGTQRVMASKLGMTPETLSRVMNRFAAEGLVALERGKVRVLDMEGLRDQAVAPC